MPSIALSQIIAVAIGGSLGAVLRFLLNASVYSHLGASFPYGTLLVNVLGSFLAGVASRALLEDLAPLSVEYRYGILLGLLGSLTTFSTFSLETVQLLEHGQFGKSLANITVNISASILAAWAGLVLARGIFLATDTWHLPDATGYILVNMLAAFVLGAIGAFVFGKMGFGVEYRALASFIFIALFVLAASFHLAVNFNLWHQGKSQHFAALTLLLTGNLAFCTATLLAGVWAGKQL